MNTLPKVLSSVIAAMLTVPEPSFGRIKQFNINKDLKSSNWEGLENKIEQLSAEDLTRVIDGICLSGNYNRIIRNNISKRNSPACILISGAFDLHVAWLKRGSGWGNSLTNVQVNQFEDYLENADKKLGMHFDNTIYEAEAKARLIRVKMGLSEGKKAQETFQYVVGMNPNHLLAHLNYFKSASPKWLGNVEILYNLTSNVKDGKLALLLKLMYVVELYSDKYYKMYDQAEGNFQKARVDLLPELLVDAKPDGEDTLLAIYTNNYLACLYRILRMPLKEFMMNKYLLGRRTVYPWAYFG